MPIATQARLEPRKSPVQARSTASVEAILVATIQVLLKVGKERLTTTRVADRAGVSVGTLYQYFPNKSALLRAVLQQHMDEMRVAVEQVCQEQAGASLEEMATTLASRFLAAKMRDAKTSVALYSVSSDVDGAKVVKEMGLKMNRAIVAMLRTAKDELMRDPETMATMLQSTLAGVSRRLVESPTPEQDYARLHDELIFLLHSYVRACAKTRPA